MQQEVEISLIKTDNKFLRLNTDTESLEKSIKAIGVINPVTLDKDNNLIAGGRRFTAMKNLGFKSVPVKIVEVDEYQQELISIDENLVRKDLNKVDMESNLRRAKELYAKILGEDNQKRYDASIEVAKFENEKDFMEISATELEEGKDAEVDVVASQKFVHEVSEKTGLSPRQIYQAIKRDEKSSGVVKQARKEGALGISQTNELIKLDHEEQEKLLPLVENKTTSEIRKLVKKVKDVGAEQAIEDEMNTPKSSKEGLEVYALTRKLNRALKKIEIENIGLTEELEEKFWKEWNNLVPMVKKFKKEEESWNDVDPLVASNAESPVENSFQ